MRLICWGCGNSLTFVQTSARGEQRTVDLTTDEPRLGEWVRVSGSGDGSAFSCQECGQEVPVEDVPIELTDTRVTTADHRALNLAGLTDRIRATLPDDSVRSIELPARPPQHAPIPSDLSPAVRRSLERLTGGDLYVHQARAMGLALDGQHVVQATSAGSGKSLGFLAPVFDGLLRSPRNTALLLYPAAALVSDQLVALRAWGTEAVEVSPGAFDLRLGAARDATVRVGRHDGQADEVTRSRLRAGGRLVLATPDSLHAALLRFGHHSYADGTSWARFFRGLRFVVLDELHQYAGSFGSAVAMVLRRLRRMVLSHGGRPPQFLAASATIGNPSELAATLTGVDPFVTVDLDGSPRAARTLLIVAPGKDGPDETTAVGAVAAGAGRPGGEPVRSLVFVPSRAAVDRVAERLRRALAGAGWRDAPSLVTAYRATLDADARATADAHLRDGTALSVVSTNALELGIDVASLSVAVLLGLPPNAASFEQRAGRVGRAGPGVVLLLPGDGPLDRFVVNDPDRFRGWLAEVRPDVRIAPDNPQVVRLFGLVPGQLELRGISTVDAAFFGEDAVDSWLAGSVGAPSNRLGGELYFEVDLGVGEPYQPLRTNLGGESFTVEELTSAGQPGRKLGRVDRIGGMLEAFPGATWRDGRGSTYRVVRVDLQENRVLARRSEDAGRWTRGVLETELEPLEELVPGMSRDGTRVSYRSLRLTYGVPRFHLTSAGRTSWEPVADPWPPLRAPATGLAVDIDRSWYPRPESYEAATNAVAAAFEAVVRLLVATDPGDIRVLPSGRSVYVHDRAGTFRWTQPLLVRFPEMAALAWQLVTACPCSTDGCPGCVRQRDDVPVSKEEATALLHRLATCWVR